MYSARNWFVIGLVLVVAQMSISKSIDMNLPSANLVQAPAAEFSSEYWQNKAREFVATSTARKFNTNIAKNLILFIGDGMSVTTLAATRVYKEENENGSLSFEKFPYTGMVKTYCIDKQVPDSACTATAYLSGIKNNMGTIGVNGNVLKNECNDADSSNYVYSIGQWAAESGKSIGLVTTTRVTHASPAGVYATIANRDWENNAKVAASCPNNVAPKDIAYQMIHGPVGKNLKVVLGGGRREFLGKQDGGLRTDGRNLIAEWQYRTNGTFIMKRDTLINVNANTTEYLLGLFSESNFEYNLDNLEHNIDVRQPSLAEMTQAAIEVLSRNKRGYFLFVEGGEIDFGHHDNEAKHALDETLEFSKAVQQARSMVSSENTLMVVSSDHSHTMTYSGYGNRSDDIFGMAGNDSDGMGYMTLSYANGKSFDSFLPVNGRRVDPRMVDRSFNNFKHPSTVPLKLETHAGDDVAVFANGPWDHLFTGIYEQNLIPHIMAYAGCIGNGLHACKKA